MKLDRPFVVMKLTTGETLFAEFVEQKDYDYVVRHPRKVRMIPVDNGREAIMLDPWIPFTEDIEFVIPDNLCYYCGMLSESFVKYYGSILLRDEISKLNLVGIDRLHAGDTQANVVRDVHEKIKDLHNDYSIKFGIPPFKHEASEDDLSEERILH